jgi:hypothetical protein
VDKLIFEGVVDFMREDGGRALISENIVEVGRALPGTEQTGMFVRIQSWDDDPDHADRHALARPLEGTRVRLTLEVLD